VIKSASVLISDAGFSGISIHPKTTFNAYVAECPSCIHYLRIEACKHTSLIGFGGKFFISKAELPMTERREPYVTRNPLDLITDQAREIERMYNEIASLRIQLAQTQGELKQARKELEALR